MAKGFFKSGHLPSLVSAFLYFDASFMVWVLLGPLGVQIARDLHLNAAQQGLMVATPILVGAVLRLPLGVFADHAGPRSAGIVAQVLVIAGLVAAWLLGVHSFSTILLVGIVLGLAGASFAVALPLASQWYPPEYQGIALGIAGAGNSGTVFAALFAPSLAVAARLAERPRPRRASRCCSCSRSSSSTRATARTRRRVNPCPIISRCCASSIAGGSCSSTASRSAALSACPRRSPSISTTSTVSPRSSPAIAPRPACSPAR